MGLRSRQFVQFGLARAFVIAVAGAAGAAALAAALSPLTPVGEARLAAADPGAVSLDPLVTLIGLPGLVAAVLLLSLWPAIRHARPRRSAALPPPAGLAVSVGTALLGMVLAVTALSATAVFGASLAQLINSPALYGAPYDAMFSNSGDDPGLETFLTGSLAGRLLAFGHGSLPGRVVASHDATDVCRNRDGTGAASSPWRWTFSSIGPGW
jgi:hypothetical protein